MPFVNERISAADRIAYEIDKLDERPGFGKTRDRNWTADHERKIYLRVFARGREETYDMSIWHLFWEGHLVQFELQQISSVGTRGGPRRAHKKITSIAIPDSISAQRVQILQDLYEALLVYKDGGVNATASSYDLQLDY